MDARIKSGHDGWVLRRERSKRVAQNRELSRLEIFLHVMASASEAIHLATQRKYGLLRCARNDGTPTPDAASRSRGAMRPRLCMNLPPKEGVGNAGCPLHPRSRVHFVLVERTRVTTSTPESPGIPARNGFTTYFVLSPVTGLVGHRHQRLKGLSAPGRADLTSA